MTAEATGTSQSTTIVNGQTSSSLTTEYTLTPVRSGSSTIGPITATVDGRSLASTPLHLEVSGSATSTGAPPAVAPSPGSARGPAFVTAEVDNKTPYVGQPIHYVLRFYHSGGAKLIGQAQYPTTTGFINKESLPPRSYEATVGGRAYRVEEAGITLLPTSAGSFEVGSTRLRCSMPIEGPPLRGAPGSASVGLALDQDLLGLLAGSDQKELSTPPVAVTVRSTPAEGRPDDFTGAVGHPLLQASLDRARARVGEAVSLELVLKGPDLDLVEAPPLPDMPGLRMAGSLSNSVTGERRFTVTLIPTQPGKLEVPAITMSVLSPSNNRYERLTTAPLTLKVDPGPAAVVTPEAEKPVPRQLWPKPTFWPTLALAVAFLALGKSSRRHGPTGRFLAVARRYNMPRRPSLLLRRKGRTQHHEVYVYHDHEHQKL